MNKAAQKVGLACVLGAFAWACSTPDATSPTAAPSLSLASIVNGTVQVCKDAGAPSGTYEFTVSQSGGRGGTLPAGSDFTLSPGECTTVWEALPDPPSSDPLVTVTTTEVNIPSDVVFDSTVAEVGGSSPVTGTNVEVSVNVNYYHGAVVTYYQSAMPQPALGRMTGGGGSVTVGDLSITKGLTLHCDITLSNNLEINWPDNKWHITKPLTSAECIDDPAVDPYPPVAPFDTFIGEGTGELNGVAGSIVRFIFVDSGEPGGKADKAGIWIWAPGADPDVDAPVLSLPESLIDHGNLQAHYDQPHGNKP